MMIVVIIGIALLDTAAETIDKLERVIVIWIVNIADYLVIDSSCRRVGCAIAAWTYRSSSSTRNWGRRSGVGETTQHKRLISVILPREDGVCRLRFWCIIDRILLINTFVRWFAIQRPHVMYASIRGQGRGSIWHDGYRRIGLGSR